MAGEHIDCPMKASDVQKWVMSQPVRTHFYVRGWARMPNGQERLVSACVSKRVFINSARSLSDSCDPETLLPLHLYVSGDWRAAYVGN